MEAVLFGSAGAFNPIAQALIGIAAPVNALGNFGSGFNGTMVLLKTVNGSIAGAEPARASTLPTGHVAYDYECRDVSDVFTYSKQFKLVLLNDQSTAQVPLTNPQKAFLRALRTTRGRAMLDLDYGFRVEASRAVGSDGRYHLSILAHPDGVNTPPYFTDVKAKLWAEALTPNGLFDRVRIIFTLSASGAISCCFGQRAREDSSHVTINADGTVSAENGPVFQGRSDGLTSELPGGDELYEMVKEIRSDEADETARDGEGSSSRGNGSGGIQRIWDMSAMMTDVDALAYQAWDALSNNRQPYMESSTTLNSDDPPALFTSGLGVHPNMGVGFQKLITSAEIATERYNYFAPLWASKLGVGSISKLPEIAVSELWKMVKDGDTDETMMRVLPSLVARRGPTQLFGTRNSEPDSSESEELRLLDRGKDISGTETGEVDGEESRDEINSEDDTDTDSAGTGTSDRAKGKEKVDDNEDG